MWAIEHVGARLHCWSGDHEVESKATNSMSSESAMPQATNTADVSMTEDHDYAEGALEEKWVSYQRQLASIFQEIVN